MRVGQRGTARDGQRGIITEVYTNAVRFLSNSGAHFTLLNAEFTPDTWAKGQSVLAHQRAQKALFSHIKPGDGFRYYRRWRLKQYREAIKRIPGYLGVPDGEVA